jgi:Holliday junction resolvase RusA-like endonuclease
LTHRAAPAVAELCFVLPFPPSVNRYYRHVGYRTLLSREGRQYRATVCALLAGRVQQPLTSHLFLQIDLYPPDRRRRDLDNAQKAIWDACQHAGLYRDDSQIKRAVLEMHEPDGQPRAEVILRPYSQRRGADSCREKPFARSANPAVASATSKSATVRGAAKR